MQFHFIKYLRLYVLINLNLTYRLLIFTIMHLIFKILLYFQLVNILFYNN